MHLRFATSATCYAILVLAGGTGLLLPETLSPPSAQAQSGPVEVTVSGVVRDFLSTHPDFNVFPMMGLGHYAGNIDTTIDPITDRPVFVGGGYRVAVEWRDVDGNPIAPHLFNVFESTACGTAGPGIAVNSLLDVGNTSRVDSFDSRLGPYGGGNAGADALLSTNSTGADMARNVNSSEIHGSVLVGPGGDPGSVYESSPQSVLTGTVDVLGAAVAMPVVEAPEMGPSSGDMTYGAGVTNLNEDLHVDDMVLEAGATLVVHGQRTIVCAGDLLLIGVGNDLAEMSLAPGASLDLYVAGNVELKRGRLNMNTGDPARCTLVKLGPGTVRLLNNQSAAAARFVAPEGTMIVRQSSEAFGSFVGESLVMDNRGEFHVDDALGTGGHEADDVAGVAGPSSDEAITSATTYDEWFRDVLGVNMSAIHDITLVRNANGVYEYLNSGFYPIDGQLLGNEGGTRNDYFTYTIDARFTYDACQGQFVEFQGGDGVWLFVNDQMVIDLGGITPFETQRIDLDRLNLADGETHRLRLYYAHRNFFSAVFRLRTNLELSTPSLPPVTAIFD